MPLSSCTPWLSNCGLGPPVAATTHSVTKISPLPGLRHDTRGQVHSQAGDVVAAPVDVAGVDADADVEVVGLQLSTDSLGHGQPG